MSKFLVLPAGIKVLVDDIDDCVIQSCNWSLTGWGYLCGTYGKYRRQYLHLIIAKRMRLNLLNEVDHEDGNIYNNQRLNLRDATDGQNARNSKIRPNNVSGYKGVSRHARKWRSEIQVNYQRIFLGSFDTPEEAHEAYCEAATKYHKEFARFE